MHSLHYEILGSPSNPPLLMVHGFMSSNLQWILNKDVLSKSYFLVMIEMWDHGQSPDAKSFDDYSPETYANELKAICDKLGIKKAGLVGHSLGAAVLIQFALYYPEYAAALLFTNSKMAVADMSLSLQKIESISDVLDKDLPEDPEELKMLARKLPMHPVHAKRIPENLKPLFIAAADRVPLKSLRPSGGKRSGMACREKLAELEMPVAIVNGVYEKNLQEYINSLRVELPAIEITDVEAGHNPNFDLATEFNQIALDFFGRTISR